MELINENQAPIVKITNLSFSYEKKKENITGLNCIIPPNAKVILAGANGAGKRPEVGPAPSMNALFVVTVWKATGKK